MRRSNILYIGILIVALLWGIFFYVQNAKPEPYTGEAIVARKEKQKTRYILHMCPVNQEPCFRTRVERGVYEVVHDGYTLDVVEDKVTNTEDLRP